MKKPRKPLTADEKRYMELFGGRLEIDESARAVSFKAINDRKLYKYKYDSIYEYGDARWGFSVRYCDELLKRAVEVRRLSPNFCKDE